MTDRIKQARDLLIQQYKESANLVGLIDAHSTQLQSLDDTDYKLLYERGIDTAVGANLDVIGKIVVLERPYTDPDPEEVFTFANPGNIGGGYTDTENSVVGGYWIGLDPIDNQKYSDSLYRFILRAKIIYNTTKATLQEMYEYTQFVFGVESVILEGIGYVDVNIARRIGRQENEILAATFPRAAGVRLGSLSYSIENGAFGFTGNSLNGGFGDLDDSTVGGVFSSLVVD
jgi:hypothetical protein